VPLNECIALNSLYVLDPFSSSEEKTTEVAIERHHRFASAGQSRAERLPSIAIAMSLRNR